jgi:hypothetical protein
VRAGYAYLSFDVEAIRSSVKTAFSESLVEAAALAASPCSTHLAE